MGDVEKVDLSKRPFTIEWTASSDVTVTCDALIVATGARAKWLGLAVGAAAHGLRRLRVRHLRRLLLQGPGRAGGRRRRHRDGGGHLPHQVREQGDGRPPPRRASAPRRSCRSARARTRRSSGVSNTRRRGDPGRRHGAASRARACRTSRPARARRSPPTGVFVAIGHKPNTDLFKGQLDMDENGYLVVPQPGAHDRHQHPRRVRRAATCRSRLPPGGHRRGLRLHGRHRRRALPVAI